MAAASAHERIAKQGRADEQVDWSRLRDEGACPVRGRQSAGESGPVDRRVDESGKESGQSVAVAATSVDGCSRTESS